jgi:hypothetical protein
MLLSGYRYPLAKKGSMAKSLAKPATPAPGRPSALLDIRVVCCGGLGCVQLARVLRKAEHI